MKTNAGREHLDGSQLQAVKEMSKAQSYAASLVELARAEEKLETIDKDLRLAKATILGHLDLKNVLLDKTLPAEKTEKVLSDVFGEKVSNLTMNFLRLLVGMGHVDLLPEVADELTKQLESVENKVVAEVTTAVAIDQKFADKLIKQLSQMVGREVTLRANVDPDIVGGIVVKVDGKLLDGSVRGQLDRLKKQMVEAG